MELFKLFGKIVVENSEANENIDESTKKAQDSSESISGSFKKIGAAIATYITVDAIKEFGLGCLTAAADASAASSQFAQVFGDLESKASSSLSKVADQGGISENRLKGSFTQIAAFAKTTGMDTESALGLSERAMMAVADSAAFYDRSIEDTTESLQSFLKGNYENDAALGLSCTEVTRNAAANKLYGKSFKDLSEDQKQLTLLQMVEDANKASGALGQAARESDTWSNVTGNLKQAWTDFQATLGSNILPTAVNVVKSLAETVTNLAEKIPAVVEWFQKYSGILAGVAAAIGTVVAGVGLYNTVTAVKLAMDAAEVTSLGALIALKLQAAAATVAMYAPYIAIAAAIAAVIAIGVLLYKNWDTIKEKCAELGAKLSEIWGNIKDTLAKTWENIKNAVKVGIMFIVELVSAAFQLITLPWRFIWENCREYIVSAWNSIKNAVSTALNFIKNLISNIWSSIVNLLSPILSKIQNSVSSAWNSVKSKTSAIFSSVKSAVSNAINGVKSSISSGLNSAKNTVSNVLGGIKSKFSSIFESAKSIVKNAIAKIKGFFNFKWSLPKLKMPHFSLKGKFSLNPPSVPKLSVEWYKKAYDNPMILNEPAIFGYNPASGKFMGGGDGSGGEVVSGANTLMGMIREAVASTNEAVVYYLQKIIEILCDYFPQVLVALQNMKLVANDGTILAYYAPKFDKELGRIKDRKDRGR